jgi:hydroxymethylglutaryl-CoA lyase
MAAVLVSEVGLRDGLQSIDMIVPLQVKKEWIAAEAAAGVRDIEVGSFVPKSVLPQLADTEELVAFAKTIAGLNVVALAPNAIGARRAIAAGVHTVSMPFSMSESHSLRNVRMGHSDMLAQIAQAAQICHAAGVRLAIGLSTAFGCTIEGHVPEDRVARLAAAACEAGADEIGLSDTAGYADPAQVRRLIRKVRGEVGESLTTLHLHNTRGLGLANALAGLDVGITTLDASLGGLGGCPFAPGASGNIVTEDLVLMLNAMGISTGIDLEQLLDVRALIDGYLPSDELYGFTFHARPMLDYQERLVR